MQKMTDWKFDLTMFDDGGAGAGGAAAASGGANEGVAESPSSSNPRRPQDKFANVLFGKQPEGAEGENAPQPAEPTEDEWKATKEKYRSFYERDTSAFVQDRLKNSKQAEATLKKIGPILADLGKKYGVDPSDIDGILKARADDDSLYEEDAAREGVSVEVYKQLKTLRDEKAAREEQEQRSAFDQHIKGLFTSFETDVKPLFPHADLMQELQNPLFQRLTSPEIGMSVADAYHAIHRAEIEPLSMQVAAQKAQEKLSQSVQSGKRRPSENGMRNNAPVREVRSDPRNWTREERAEALRRAEMGQKIYL